MTESNPLSTTAAEVPSAAPSAAQQAAPQAGPAQTAPQPAPAKNAWAKKPNIAAPSPSVRVDPTPAVSQQQQQQQQGNASMEQQGVGAAAGPGKKGHSGAARKNSGRSNGSSNSSLSGSAQAPTHHSGGGSGSGASNESAALATLQKQAGSAATNQGTGWSQQAVAPTQVSGWKSVSVPVAPVPVSVVASNGGLQFGSAPFDPAHVAPFIPAPAPSQAAPRPAVLSYASAAVKSGVPIVSGSVPKHVQEEIKAGIVAPAAIQFGSLNVNSSPFNPTAPAVSNASASTTTTTTSHTKPKNALPFLPQTRANQFEGIERVRSAPPNVAEQEKIQQQQQQQQPASQPAYQESTQPQEMNKPPQFPPQPQQPHLNAGVPNFNPTAAAFTPGGQPAMPYPPQYFPYGAPAPFMFPGFAPQGFPGAPFQPQLPNMGAAAGAPMIPIPGGYPPMPLPPTSTTTPIFKIPERKKGGVKITNPETKEELSFKPVEDTPKSSAVGVASSLTLHDIPAAVPSMPIKYVANAPVPASVSVAADVAPVATAAAVKSEADVEDKKEVKVVTPQVTPQPSPEKKQPVDSSTAAVVAAPREPSPEKKPAVIEVSPAKTPVAAAAKSPVKKAAVEPSPVKKPAVVVTATSSPAKKATLPEKPAPVKVESTATASPPVVIDAASSTEKKVYSIAFLMQFKETCKEAPPNWEQVECLINTDSGAAGGFGGGGSSRRNSTRGFGDRGSMGGMARGSRQSDVGLRGAFRGSSGAAAPMRFPPPGLTKGGIDRGSGRQSMGFDRGSARRASNRGGRHSNERDSQYSSNLPEVILAKGENRWMPSFERPKVAAEKLDYLDQLSKDVKSLLNKLTVENFDKIHIQVNSLKLPSTEAVDTVVYAIFEKGIEEVKFSGMYAKLFKALIATLSNFDAAYMEDNSITDSKGQYFRRRLLTLCQKEFEASSQWNAETVDTKLTDDMTAEELAEHVAKESERRKMKRRTLGNIRFVGELFNLSMLPETIMHSCVKSLLTNIDSPEEEELESVCNLMNTVGHKLDHANAKDHMDAYFGRLTKISDNQAVPSRLRFKIKDVLDLRLNNWVIRARQQALNAGPMKLQDVQKETDRLAREELKNLRNKEAAQSKAAMLQRRSATNASAAGSRGSDGGWNVVKSAKDAGKQAKPEKTILLRNQSANPYTVKAKKDEASAIQTGKPAEVVKSASGNLFDALADSESAEEVADSQPELFEEPQKAIKEEKAELDDYMNKIFAKEYLAACLVSFDQAFSVFTNTRAFVEDEAVPDLMVVALEKLIPEVASAAYTMSRGSEHETQVLCFADTVARAYRFELVPDVDGFLERQFIDMPDNCIDVPGLDICLGHVFGELVAVGFLDVSFVQNCIAQHVENVDDFTPRLLKAPIVSPTPITKFFGAFLCALNAKGDDVLLDSMLPTFAEEASRIYTHDLTAPYSVEDVDANILKNPWWGTNTDMLAMVPDASVAEWLNSFGLLEVVAPSLAVLIDLNKTMAPEITSQGSTEVDAAKVQDILKTIPAATKANPAHVRTLISFFARHIQRIVTFKTNADKSLVRADVESALMKKWFAILKSDEPAAAVGHQLQTEILYALQELGSYGDFKIIEQYFKRAFEALYEVDAVQEEAFKLWEQNGQRQMGTKELAMVRGGREFLKWLAEAETE